MSKIKDKTQYDATMQRIEELCPLVQDDTPKNDRYLIELDLLTSLIEEYEEAYYPISTKKQIITIKNQNKYEEAYYPISTPSLIDVIKLRMHEMGLTQAKLSTLLNVSPSRISDYLNGRCEPTLAIAREISKKLNIDASIVLGV